MWLRIVGGFAMATALPLAPSAQAQPSPIAVKTDKSWTHKPSGIAFPSKIDGFARSTVEDLSNGALLDTSIAYDDPISRTHVNVYVYHAAMPATVLANFCAAPDHPVLSTCPETEYLKAAWMIMQ